MDLTCKRSLETQLSEGRFLLQSIQQWSSSPSSHQSQTNSDTLHSSQNELDNETQVINNQCNVNKEKNKLKEKEKEKDHQIDERVDYVKKRFESIGFGKKVDMSKFLKRVKVECEFISEVLEGKRVFHPSHVTSSNLPRLSAIFSVVQIESNVSHILKVLFSFSFYFLLKFEV